MTGFGFYLGDNGHTIALVGANERFRVVETPRVPACRLK